LSEKVITYGCNQRIFNKIAGFGAMQSAEFMTKHPQRKNKFYLFLFIG